MYAGTAEKITIETDDRGFELHIETDEAYISVNIQAIAEEFYDHVKASIGPWLKERDEAWAEFKTQLKTGEYDASDPKHPDFHSVHVDLYDSREGK